ncbi:MAG: C13 family peptidase, partial [Fimbriimonadaceae bacterium]
FDNARKRISTLLLHAEFPVNRIAEFTADPAKVDDVTNLASLAALRTKLDLLTQSTEGCLVYLTTHGGPFWAKFGQSDLATPGRLAEILDNTCGQRPTMLVISACYSGTFLSDGLVKPNRLILTATDRDSPSFGCNSTATLPLFDQCFIESAANSRGVVNHARATISCVEKLERSLRYPRSDPQLYVGDAFIRSVPELDLRPPRR